MARQGIISSFLFIALTAWSTASAEGLRALALPQSDEGSLDDVKSEVLFLAVDKKNLKAELRTLPEPANLPTTLRSFRIAIGKEFGDKVREGDNRTPEGVYFARRIIDGSKLPAKYGPKAIPINFPNPIDRLEKKSGHGIWLHGVERDSRVEEANVTEGCVAFYNDDIVRLSGWLKPYQGIVVIADDVSKVNQPSDVKQLQQLTQKWYTSWQQRDIDAYISHYHEKLFRYRGMNLDQFQAYKKRVFSSYKSMTLDISDLRVIAHPKYAMTIMNQDFNGDDRFISNGRKILYWTKDQQGRWKILVEDFENRRLEAMSYTPEQVAKLVENVAHRASAPEISAAPQALGSELRSDQRRNSPKL